MKLVIFSAWQLCIRFVSIFHSNSLVLAMWLIQSCQEYSWVFHLFHLSNTVPQ